jgi:hypothetical protein
MGFPPDTLYHDVEGRPLPISQGRPVTSILD